jgi:hypothetical protein
MAAELSTPPNAAPLLPTTPARAANFGKPGQTPGTREQHTAIPSNPRPRRTQTFSPAATLTLPYSPRHPHARRRRTPPPLCSG